MYENKSVWKQKCVKTLHKVSCGGSSNSLVCIWNFSKVKVYFRFKWHEKQIKTVRECFSLHLNLGGTLVNICFRCYARTV